MPAAGTCRSSRHRHHRTDTTDELSSSFRRTSITLDGNKEIALTGASLISNEVARTLKFEDHYIIQEQLAKGSFGTVYATEHVATGDAFAVKVIERSRLSEKDKDLVIQEVDILNECRDIVNIVQLVDFFDSPEKYHVVQVRAMGGDVFGRLAGLSSYNEKNARDLAYHLIVAMKALHERRIAHRDLKPENLLLRDKEDDTSILVADFGFAKHVPPGLDGRLTSRCGTPAFVAPEVLVRDCQYTEQVDMWSTGCLLYMIICGYPPFQDRNHQGLFRKIRGADFTFHDQYWKDVSVSAKQLIASLLHTDPKYRWTAAEALEKSCWLRAKAAELTKKDLSSSLTEMRKLQRKRLLKGAAHAVVLGVKLKLANNNNNNSNAAASLDKQVDNAWNDDSNNSWDRYQQDDDQQKRVDRALLSSTEPSLRFEDVYELTPGQEPLHANQANGVEIWACQHKERKENYAVKIINDNDPNKILSTGKNVSESVLHELAVLKSLKHPHIIDIIDFFEQDDKFYLVMERMDGGDVFDRIINLKKYTEMDAQNLARILLDAVYSMHSQGVVHRDLKPQNILLKYKEQNYQNIKLADFSFASRVHTPRSLTTRCGTPTYVAPEILKNIPYDQSADMWSVGVILYTLLVGYPPFASENQSTLFQKIRTADYTFVPYDWKNISPSAQDLIRNLLTVDPAKRMTAKQALYESEWLRDEDVKRLSSSDLSSSVTQLRVTRKHSLKSIAKMIICSNSSSTRSIPSVEEDDDEEDQSEKKSE